MKFQQKSDTKSLIPTTAVLKMWQLNFYYRSGLCITEAFNSLLLFSPIFSEIQAYMFEEKEKST